jgi:hypothetical protein
LLVVTLLASSKRYISDLLLILALTSETLALLLGSAFLTAAAGLDEVAMI